MTRITAGVMDILILLAVTACTSQAATSVSVVTEAAAASSTLASTATSVPTIEPTPDLAVALAGGTSNNQWKPYSQEFEGVKMVLVPRGCFMMGSHDGRGDETPVNKQCLDHPFWIDVTEVTNIQFDSLGGQAQSSSYWTGDNRPRESITWDKARAFCEKRGARLPTEAEWEYAARGPDDLRYPWGNEFSTKNVVAGASQTADVGSIAGGASWVGALDMSGNVWEWVSSWYAPYPYHPTDGREGLLAGDAFQHHVRRGGSWDDNSDILRAAKRGWLDPSQVNSSTGFRCARPIS